jgi:hypothetical protein
MIYPSIRIEGSILSPDILDKLEEIPGQRSVDFGLEVSVKVKDEISRAWADAQDYWRIYNRKLETLKKESPATTETRNLWVVPLLGLFGYQLEYEAKSIELNSKLYPISHRITNRGGAAIHIIGSNEPAGLDRKPEKSTLRMSAHAMVQEYLNLTEQLYGIVTNGRVIRLLRDSSRLIKLTYLEFDLDRIFSDGLFADFAVLYRLLHVTRFPQTIDASATSLLEKYHQDTIEQGSRIRDGLRIAVNEALETLGTGFLAHSDNFALRQQVDSGELRHDIYFNYLLRLIYRLLFLMVIEERGLVFPKGITPQKSIIYVRHYSIERLRRQAKNRSLHEPRNSDAWQQLLSTFHLFENSDAAAVLGTTVLGGQLFNPANLGLLPSCTLSNAVLYSTLEKLCFFTHPENRHRMPVNFGALATEEFGSVYESLLELHPVIELQPNPFFGFRQAAGNERKTTGSYYTHSSLVESLLQSALDPLLDKAEKSSSPEKSILALKVCDPACGSGHFLIAAAQRIARRLARLRAGDEEPSPELIHHTLREVIGHCIFGVDINPMAAELCRVALWLEAMEPGKPLSFLEHHIRVGNSLLGTTPELITAGIPNEAFNAIPGNDKKACSVLKKRNNYERTSMGPLFAMQEAKTQALLKEAAAKLEELPEDRLEDIRAKELAFRRHEETDEYRQKKRLADTWCAAFVIDKYFSDQERENSVYGITQRHLNDLVLGKDLPSELSKEVDRLSEQYQFFHWYLSFPELFAKGGFDCVLGNPPWEQLEQQNSFTFNKVIAGTQHFIEHSNKFPITGEGRKNLYGLFAELISKELSLKGVFGLILPTGILQDQPASALTEELSRSNRIASVFDFENRRKDRDGEKWFRDAHPQQRFCLFTSIRNNPQAKFIFDVSELKELNDSERFYFQSFDNIQSFCESGFKVPMFRCAIEAQIAIEAYRHGIMLGKLMRGESPVLKSWLMFNAEPAIKRLKKTYSYALKQGQMVRVYEGSYIHHFDHRLSTYESDSIKYVQAKSKSDPNYFIITKDYLPTLIVHERLRYLLGYLPNWLLVLRRQARATDSFISISTVIPCVATEGNLTGFSFRDNRAIVAAMLCANFNSFMFNFLTRLRQAGANLNKNVYSQIPIIDETTLLGKQSAAELILPRVLELTYTAYDLTFFAKDCGWSGPPFQWDEERRFLLLCELNAFFFHLYIPKDNIGSCVSVENEKSHNIYRNVVDFSTPRLAVDYIMDAFPIVRRKDEQKYGGDYRTKRIILEIYDALTDAIRDGKPYKTKLNPPPADPSCCHPPKTEALM